VSPGTALEVLRERAVAMREAGNAQLAIASALGVHKNTVQRWPKGWRIAGAAAPKAKKRGAWVAEHRARIELSFLPACAPEHHPDEFLHSDLKQSLSRRPAAKDRAGLESRLRGYLRRLQRQPERVRAFFPGTDHPLCRLAPLFSHRISNVDERHLNRDVAWLARQSSCLPPRRRTRLVRLEQPLQVSSPARSAGQPVAASIARSTLAALPVRMYRKRLYGRPANGVLFLKAEPEGART
jgi:transposase